MHFSGAHPVDCMFNGFFRLQSIVQIDQSKCFDISPSYIWVSISRPSHCEAVDTVFLRVPGNGALNVVTA